MRITNIFHELLYDKDRLTITFDRKDRQQIIEKLESLGEIDQSKEYDVEIKKHRQKRSLDANGYMWALADKIAYSVHSTKEEVYRKAIREVGVFTDVAVTDGAVEELERSWNSNGIGWVSERFDSKLQGCKKVRLYTGSSQYTSKEMSRLIDYIVDEAKGLAIETMTPDEIAELKSKWGN